jgi:hypothetical protein
VSVIWPMVRKLEILRLVGTLNSGTTREPALPCQVGGGNCSHACVSQDEISQGLNEFIREWRNAGCRASDHPRIRDRSLGPERMKPRDRVFNNHHRRL